MPWGSFWRFIVPRPDNPHAKRATNLSVRADLVERARGADVNLSALLERALIEELRARRGRAWRQQNARAIEAYNTHTDKHGVFTDPRWCS
jgi:antitoxin CcdA